MPPPIAFQLFQIPGGRTASGSGSEHEVSLDSTRFSLALACGLSVLLVAACAPGDASRSGSPVREGRVLVAGADRIVRPATIMEFDSKIVIADAEAPFIRVFRSKNGDQVAVGGVGGSGPHEMQYPASLSEGISPSGEKILTVFDSRLQRLLHFAIDDSTIVPVGDDVQIALAGGFSDVLQLPSGDYVASGGFVRDAYQILSPTGTPRRSGGVLPFVSADVPPSLAQQVISGTPALDPSGRRLAIGARFAGRIDIYDLESGAQDSVAAPTAFAPEMRSRSNGAMDVLLTDGDTQFGYISVAASECCIFGLFSGRTRRTFPHVANFGHDIHVFSWSGELVQRLRLDRDLRSIVASPDGKYLIGLSEDPEPTILRYDL